MGGKYYGDIQASDNSRLHLGDVNNYYGDQELLKHVPGAQFNAYGLGHRACHPETRRELLEESCWKRSKDGLNIIQVRASSG